MFICRNGRNKSMKHKNVAPPGALFRHLVFFMGFLLVIFFAFTDVYISYHPALIIFYLIPVSLVTWFSGTMAGVFIAFCSIIAWLSHDVSSVKSLYINPALCYINMTTRGSFLFFIVYVLRRLKIALAREKEFNERKSVFVANVAHEVKAPLAIAIESLGIILDKKSGEIGSKDKAFLEMTRRNMERLLRLATDLLDLSAIEAGKMELKTEEVDMVSLVNGVLETFDNEISDKRVVINKDLQNDIGPLRADGDRLAQVIINLLANAIKYAPGGTITIRLKGTDNKIRFEIIDTGPGIAEEDRERIFDKFERIRAEKQEGTGLGLSIARDIIKLHKGKIWVESEAGKGSRFIFVLPKIQE